MVPTRDRCEDGEEDLDFAITYSPAKVTHPGSPPFPPVDAAVEDKLPSIVSRSPSRIDTFGAVGLPATVGTGSNATGSGNALVPTGTPGTGRSRPGRIMDNPLQTKLSIAKLDKHSPRTIVPGMGTLVPSAKPGAGVGAASPSSNLKRNPSSTGNSRGRPRQGTANGSSGDKSHAERAAAHASEAERLPVAHQKTTRRRSDHIGDISDHAESSRGGAGSGGHGLESTGKKTHGGHGELAAPHD